MLIILMLIILMLVSRVDSSHSIFSFYLLLLSSHFIFSLVAPLGGNAWVLYSYSVFS